MFNKLGLNELSSGQFSDDVGNRLRREQLRGTIEQMRVMLLGNTFFAPVLSFQAWNHGSNHLVVIWTAAIILYSWWLFLKWRITYKTTGSSKDMRRFTVETFVNSLFWTTGMALFYPLVSGDEKAIITTVIAGALALGTMGFSRAPAAAFAYLGVQIVGNSLVALFCGLQTGSSSDFLIFFLTIAAGVSLYSATVERGKSAITAFKDQEKLNEKKEVVELLLRDYERQATEWLWQTDQSGKIIRAPAQVLELFGLTERDIGRVPSFAALGAECTEACQPDIERLRMALKYKTEFHDVRLSVTDPKDGRLRWILIKGMPQFDLDEFRGFRGIFADATASIEADQKLKFLATHDSLTKLLNRDALQECLLGLRTGDHFATAFAVDLDGFKQINDSYGHDIGDLLLIEVAKRLRRVGTVETWAARIGGDEFFILCRGQHPIKRSASERIATEICKLLSDPFQIGEFKLQISASVGVAQFPRDTSEGLELLSFSDLALYDAKHNGGDLYAFFDINMQDQLNRRVAIIERMKTAIQNGDIQPHYQSQHALSDGRLIGFEALARWTDDQLGVIGPDVFIPIAEQTGLIVELGEQILRTACHDAVRWANQLGDLAPVVSVNFSPVQFSRIDVVALIKKVLAETGLPARLLEVEVTEGVFITSQEKVAVTLNEISALGVSIALDDFGTGYSSLSYLKRLPLNRLKVDRSFVTDLQHNSKSPIVSAIVQLGHNLNLSVIAEGIESQIEVQALAAMGCDDGQGFLFGRPMSVEATDQFVSQMSVINLKKRIV
ncbi:EAL domain-containing protein [Octadecabacter sp. 1_MG-2023]|uniref:putative bifunctional diguanylate cyclase/phosphodiesterase n=1 Tax=unclassified Octadecabacter TaxID=196158 RepID=UPI001C089A6F|nr:MULTISPECIES: EAL domain-containing protein [unclassified Octadecabacter]MBU2993677.1 EAL domain-containing protein [Octadecabacter sp. B2R22]MDO6735479.1 EAL domain-containing protein [Octadecabacter sp. 1_MG-2023]